MNTSDRLYLVSPQESDAESVWQFRGEFSGHNASGDIPGSGSLGLSTSYSNWLRRVRQLSSEDDLPKGLVVASTFLAKLIQGDDLVGVVQIRHTLNAELTREGGHIGYSIAPDHRGLGLGRELLRHALRRCSELGLDRALVTCDDTNVASARIIELNGGVLENKVEANGQLKRRYWIRIKPETRI